MITHPENNKTWRKTFEEWYSSLRKKTGSGENFSKDLIELILKNSSQKNWPVAFRTEESFRKNVSKLKEMECM